jgi:hypothetical protein
MARQSRTPRFLAHAALCATAGSTPLTGRRDYRCYLLGSDDRIKDVFEFAAPSDGDAIAIAECRMTQIRIYAGIELWQGLRQVYVRLPPPPDHA